MNLSQETIKDSGCSRPPYLGPGVEISGHVLPLDFLSILRVTNGLITKDCVFRVFGTESGQLIPSVFEWNAAEWKQQYGELAESLVFVAEDIFGDQYGYDFRDGRPLFVKFYCDGGQAEQVPGGVNQLVESLIEPRRGLLVDFTLLDSAFGAGLVVNAQQHLAFRVPLIVGGTRGVENLCVESVALHLGTLAQIAVRNTSLPEGAMIRRFKK